jgi:PAS domain S-box-containing protein
MIGLPEEAVVGKQLDTVFHVVNENTREPIESPVKRVLEEGQLVGQANHTLLLSHTGAEIPIDDNGAPIRDKNGKIQGTVLVFRDVRERRRTERELAENAQRLQLAIQGGRMGIWQWVPATRTLRGSATLGSILGRAKEDFEISFDQYLAAIHPEDRAAVRESLETSLDGGADHTLEYRVSWPDATERWIYSRGRGVRSDGSVGVIGIAMDITERRQLDNALRRAKEFDEAVMNNMGEGLYTVDSHGRVTFMNPAAEQMFGWTLPELKGKRMHDVTHYLHRDGTPFPAEDCPGLQVLNGGVTLNGYEDTFIHKDGTFFDVIYSSAPLQDGDRATGLVVVFRDITERKRAEEAIRSAAAELSLSNQQLLRSNADLERFAFVASHDLQEPLRMITTYAQLLVREYGVQEGSKAESYVQYISDGTERMRDLLADLRTYTELRGAPVEAPQPVDLEQVLETVKLNLQVSIEEAQAEITNDPLLSVTAHAPHMVSLFQNLIGNALKYRGDRPARIHIGVHRVGPEIRFAVCDEGIGISPEYHDQIFVAFKRLHGRKTPGTGIGLAICQRIVEHYGGRIWVESETGKGATFYFTLPGAMELEPGGVK